MNTPADAAGGKGGNPGGEKPGEGKQGLAGAKERGPEGLPPGAGPQGVASSKGRSDRVTSNNPGGGMTGPRPPGTTGVNGPDQEATGLGDPSRHRASMIQLEEFRKKVDRNILRDLKMTPEEFEKFLKDYADLARRREVAGPPEALPSSRAGAGTLPSAGGRPLQSTGSKDDAISPGRAKPPPGYRDAHAEFLRMMSGSDK
jgi:hypothetical protein